MMSVAETMWRPKNLLEALLPIFIINVIFCHGVIPYPSVRKSKIFHSFLYSIFTTIGHFICVVYVYLKYFNDHWIQGFHLIYFTVTIIVNVLMNVNIIISWFYKTKILMINTRIIKADTTLDKLGVPVCSQKEYCFSKKILFLWIVHLIFINSIRIIWWRYPLDLQSIILIAFVLQHAYHVNFLIDLMFFVTIKHMKVRFKNVNELLSDIFKQQINFTSISLVDRKWAITRQMKYNPSSAYIIQSIKRIHLELGLLCDELVKIFQVPIVLTTITSFVASIGLLMRLYLNLIDSKISVNTKVLNVTVLMSWFSIYAIKIFSINYICEETVEEWKKTGEIVHKIEIETKNPKLRNELQQFSIQQIKNPLKFTPCGFFDLSYYFVRDFAGSMTAYLVLLIQTYSNNS